MENSTAKGKSKSADIRGEFDKILMQHVSSFIDTREDIAALPFNLATIACLLLLAERENEIKSFPQSPPERYNRETFFNDIEDVGIDLDEEVMLAIQNLDQYGFVVVNSKNQYMARDSAALLISVLDSIFPQMPGMNLVAYVSQTIEEVVSGRKELRKSLDQFDQTLAKQGVRLSTLSKDRMSDQAPSPQKPDPAVLLERRTAYLHKLKALRDKNLQSAGDPAIVGVDRLSRKFEIHELFPKAPDQPSSQQPPDEISSVESEESLPDGIPLPQMSAMDDPLMANGHAPVSESDDDVDLQESVSEHEQPPDIPEKDIFVETGTDTVLEEDLSLEDQIENKIRIFEQELAMPCPICDIGKVLSDTTEKGKTYYHCSNEECRFISWGKPYHMECPVCKNPFLVETTDPEGNIILKCPRATCLYRKKSAADEILDGLNGKKRVVVRKKRGKKGVRRVVRRKS